MKMTLSMPIAIALVWLATGGPAHAQGQDSTPAERNRLVLAELLPGVYDNVNQAYFDKRRALPDADRHERIRTTITRVNAPAFGEYAFLWVNRRGADASAPTSWRIATLELASDPSVVVMRHFFPEDNSPTPPDVATLVPQKLRSTPGCEYEFVRRADHYAGRQRARACRFQWEGRPVYTDNEIQVSRSDLWFHDHKYEVNGGRRITGVASGEPFWLERARLFHCYADVPGVGGGRAEPFERFDGLTLYDKGDVAWFRTTRGEPRELGISLQAVTWHVLNERGGAFNRDSLVLYVRERLANGTVEERGYSFTSPDADRIGVNLKWLLANCALVPRSEARPEM
jgi:hypothetical protein